MADASSSQARRPFHRRRKTCPFSGANAPKIDYKDAVSYTHLTLPTILRV